MTPAERLIVALDGENPTEVFLKLYDAGISHFKLGMSYLVDPRDRDELDNDRPSLLRRIVDYKADLFLDLKLYDTRDTVDRTIRRAFDLGARFITVHATPSIMEAAMRAKPADPRCKVLAVPTLTDQNLNLSPMIDRINAARSVGVDGIICPVDLAAAVRGDYPDLLLVCPGVRPASVPADNHKWVATPAVAIHRGADYLVVGRPIWQASDPAGVATAILAEIQRPN